MSDQQRHTMTEAEFDALCKWLESPKGCTFQQEIPGESESITWTVMARSSARDTGCAPMV